MKNRVLIYDDNCPMCAWYSSLFVKVGLLPAAGRKAFSTIEPALLAQIDFFRGRHEIPLIDLTSQTTYYGIDALLELLGTKMPIIRTIGKWKPVYWSLQKLYRLISFNRKVIVASKCGPGAIDCAPEMNTRYRLLFLLLSLLTTTLLLTFIHRHLLTHLSFYHLTLTEVQTAHFTLVAMNCTLCLLFKKERAFEYIGQVNMLALLTVLLIVPVAILQIFFTTPVLFVGIYLAFVAIVVFKEYIRRMHYASVLTSHYWIAAINLACMTGFLLFLFH